MRFRFATSLVAAYAVLLVGLVSMRWPAIAHAKATFDLCVGSFTLPDTSNGGGITIGEDDLGHYFLTIQQDTFTNTLHYACGGGSDSTYCGGVINWQTFNTSDGTCSGSLGTQADCYCYEVIPDGGCSSSVDFSAPYYPMLPGNLTDVAFIVRCRLYDVATCDYLPSNWSYTQDYRVLISTDSTGDITSLTWCGI